MPLDVGRHSSGSNRSAGLLATTTIRHNNNELSALETIQKSQNLLKLGHMAIGLFSPNIRPIGTVALISGAVLMRPQRTVIGLAFEELMANGASEDVDGAAA